MLDQPGISVVDDGSVTSRRVEDDGCMARNVLKHRPVHCAVGRQERLSAEGACGVTPERPQEAHPAAESGERARGVCCLTSGRRFVRQSGALLAGQEVGDDEHVVKRGISHHAYLGSRRWPV